MPIEIREAVQAEYPAIGELTVRVYQQLPGMPGPEAMPEYYAMLADVQGRLTAPSVKVVAACKEGTVLGAVMYYGDMAHYGSGGAAPQQKNAAGIRLLAVDFPARGQGLGRRLTEYCLGMAQADGLGQVILHTTKTMQQAWEMYERMGFERFPDLDFMQGPLPVFGFRKHPPFT